MPAATLIARYRPLRVGFLVRQGSAEDVRTAVKLATLIWGGIYDPIIPVPDDGSTDAVDELIDGFRVDGVFAVADVQVLNAVVHRHRERLHLFETAIFEGTSPQVVDIGVCCEHTERHMRPGDARLVRATWVSDTADGLQLAALFGEFADDDDAAALQSAYDQLGDEMPVDTLLTDDAHQHDVSAIDFAALELEADYLSPPETVILVGDPHDAGHICAYWNFRAAGHDAFFWSGDDGGLERRRIERHLAGLNVQQMKRFHHSLHIAFPTWDGSGAAPIPDDLKSAAPDGLDVVVIPNRQLVSAWGSNIVPVMEFATEGREVMGTIDSGDELELLTLSLPQRPFDADYRFHHVWIVSLSAMQETAYRGTLRPPYLPDLNTWLSRKIALVASVRVEFRGLGIVWEPSRGTLELRPVDEQELVAEILRRAGIEAELSVPGRALPQIIDQLGNIGRARIFRFPGVRELIALREAHTGIARTHAVNLIADSGNFRHAEPFYVSRRRIQNPSELFDFLLSRNVFLPGLELLCTRCHQHSVHELGQLGDDVRCPRCGNVFGVGPALTKDPFRYRISGLLEQRGQHVYATDRERRPAEAPSVLLTWLALYNFVGSGSLTILPSHLLAGTIPNCESDLIALERSRALERNGAAVVFAECKTLGEVTDADVMNLGRAAAAVRATGIDSYVLFSTLKERFSDKELWRFLMLRDTELIGDTILARPPILLTRRELEGRSVPPDTKGSVPHISTLEHLAWATNAAYLRE
ncbi:MAG: hypothetical protein QOH16_725 [Gaiellaceae bacterium]|nr:hypothetical protein [Gaiellaceae bacterium]